MRRNCTFRFFSYQKEQGTEREEIFRLPLHVWMPLAGYPEDQTEKRGKEEPVEVLEDEETIAWILQCQANDEHAVDEEGNWLEQSRKLRKVL